MKTISLALKPYIQPFEKHLALRELAAISRAEPIAFESTDQVSRIYYVETDQSLTKLAANLAYWETVRNNGRKIFTTQIMRESTVSIARNGVTVQSLQDLLPYGSDPLLPNRRCLRYGPHGIHEYRGKFFPQLVRALINISDLSKPNSIIADTMCGSGTTLVEASLARHVGIGLDMNPLSVFISKAKCNLLRVPSDDIIFNYNSVVDRLRNISNPRYRFERRPIGELDVCDKEYLNKWFASDVLNDLNRIFSILMKVTNPIIRDFMVVSFSNILRRVSWQKNDDLRVRREIETDIASDPIKEFLEDLERSVKTVVAFSAQDNGKSYGRTHIYQGDSRNPKELLRWSNRVDAVITSPPYATALPYIDTDRLSLIFLGLLCRKKHRTLELEMIGHRDISERRRKLYWEMYLQIKKTLPSSVTNLIQEIYERNENANVGFRRKNLPALLAKYFIDMRSTFIALHALLKRHSFAYVVIGNNHTYAGGKKVNIKTEVMLTDIAQQVGFTLEDRIPMDMLVSRDIFKENAIGSETILYFRKL
jgi:hypothetical protein